MTLIEEELQASQAAEPLLITDVERVEVESPATLPEGYAVDVTYTSPDDEAVNAQVHVVRFVKRKIMIEEIPVCFVDVGELW